MVFSYYIFKIPCEIVFHVLKFFKLNDFYIAYLGDELDYNILKPVLKYLPELQLVCKNRKLQKKLQGRGVKAKRLPVFPRGVVMARLAAHKFPASSVKKIGLRHGPYHFKSFSDKKNYLLFKHYIFTSEFEAQEAKERGITNGIGLGYPKLDTAFLINSDYLSKLQKSCGLDKNKKTLFFTATWDKSGMSAIDKWYDKLDELKEEFNIIVSLHPWISKHYRDFLEREEGIFLLKDCHTIPYMMLAEICIGDTSSILAECCALDKAMITFKVNSAQRLEKRVVELIGQFSLSINNFAELLPAIRKYEHDADLKKEEREQANRIFFSNLDGTASKKIADFIRKEFNL